MRQTMLPQHILQGILGFFLGVEVANRGFPYYISLKEKVIMQIFWTIVVGFLVGLVAKLLMPGRDPRGFWITALLGIGGSLAGRYIGVAMGFYEPTDRVGFIASVLGAMILLVLYHFIARRMQHPVHPKLPNS